MKTQSLTTALAFLVAAFMWGCQESGPVAPEGLGPQFDKPGTPGELCPGAGGQVRDAKGHCHDDEEPTVGPVFTVTVTSTSGDISGGPENTTPVRGGEIIVFDVFELNLAFFLDKVTCGSGMNLGTSKTGTLWVATGDDHTHLFFSFLHNDAKHHIDLLGTPPTATDPVTVMQSLNGDWEVKTKGTNHKDGCTGEGGGITWEATVVPVP